MKVKTLMNAFMSVGETVLVYGIALDAVNINKEELVKQYGDMKVLKFRTRICKDGISRLVVQL